MQPPYENIPMTFFVPGEAYLVLEHDRALQGQALLDRLRRHPLVQSDDRLAAAIDNVKPSGLVTISGPSAIPGGCNWIVALILRTLGLDRGNNRAQADSSEWLQQPPARLTSMVFTTVSQFNSPETQQAFIQDFIRPLYYRAKEFQQDGDELTVETIAPNWLSGGAPGQFGMGGPGAQPVPTDPNVKDRPWIFTMPRSFARGLGNQGRAVEVAVLDTVPSREALNRAFNSPAFADHELLQQVKQQTASGLSISRLITDSIEHSWLNDPQIGIALREHFYNMSDHGLFVAGVIASIARQANIRIIEVLSHFGVGTVQTIASGLNQLLSQRRSHTPLIVNLSLTLELPTRQHLPPDWENDPKLSQWDWFVAWLDENPQFIEDSFVALRKLCDELSKTGALIVAAAGNNGTPNNHPPARFPAAFSSVTGVGALNHDGSTAGYSNQADTPGNVVGIVTYGGDVDAVSHDQADADNGMLGLFIGAFPDGQPSDNGWARWAGTSFATPIIAGTVAHLVAGGDTPQQALQRIRNAQADFDPALGPGEVFSAKQG